MAADRSGRVYILNTGNLDVATSIGEIFDSPHIYQKLPGTVQKSKKIDLYFSRQSSGTLYYQDRADFSSVFATKQTPITITLADSLTHIIKSIDLPSTENIYQFRLSSSGNAMPWKLTHIDYFSNLMGIGVGNG